MAGFDSVARWLQDCDSDENTQLLFVRVDRKLVAGYVGGFEEMVDDMRSRLIDAVSQNEEGADVKRRIVLDMAEVSDGGLELTEFMELVKKLQGVLGEDAVTSQVTISTKGDAVGERLLQVREDMSKFGGF